MKHVLSNDGTPIAYERSGEGPAVILVGGLVDRTENMPLAQALAEHFTVYIYDQRGRGHSGDTQPYNVRREIEDLGAVIALAGRSAHVYGASAGGALGLEAAAAGLPIDRLAVYEVSYGITDGPEQWRQYISTLEGLIADGRRGDAFALFMRTAGAPERDIESARRSPAWPSLEAVAHTLVYGAACLGDGQPPRERLAQITCPTLVLTGTELDPHMSELPPGVFQRTAAAIAEAVPAARLQALAGQNHMVEAKVLAPVLESFFLQ
jgi:pimeloyl-ACP methyl ester carboxylesterase